MSAQGRSDDGPVRPEDLEVTLAVRRDLGPEHDPAVVAEFLDRVGHAIDERVDSRVAAHRAAAPPGPQGPPGPPGGRQRSPSIALPVVSLVTAVPITAVTLGVTDGSPPGVLLMLVAWLSIVAVNVAHARRS